MDACLPAPLAATVEISGNEKHGTDALLANSPGSDVQSVHLCISVVRVSVF